MTVADVFHGDAPGAPFPVPVRSSHEATTPTDETFPNGFDSPPDRAPRARTRASSSPGERRQRQQHKDLDAAEALQEMACSPSTSSSSVQSQSRVPSLEDGAVGGSSGGGVTAGGGTPQNLTSYVEKPPVEIKGVVSSPIRGEGIDSDASVLRKVRGGDAAPSGGGANVIIDSVMEGTTPPSALYSPVRTGGGTSSDDDDEGDERGNLRPATAVSPETTMPSPTLSGGNKNPPSQVEDSAKTFSCRPLPPRSPPSASRYPQDNLFVEPPSSSSAIVAPSDLLVGDSTTMTPSPRSSPKTVTATRDGFLSALAGIAAAVQCREEQERKRRNGASGDGDGGVVEGRGSSLLMDFHGERSSIVGYGGGV